MFHKHRLEALSDAVFAIVMTLLVLDLKAPIDAAHGNIAAALSGESHAWFSFAMTFTIAAIYWTLQHHVFDVIQDPGHESLVPTFFFLGFITLLPFTTSLCGKQHIDRLAFVLYFANLFAASFSLMVKMELARAKGRLCHNVDTRFLRFRLIRVSLAMLCAVASSWWLPMRYFFIGPLAAVFASRIVQRLAFKKMRAPKTEAAAS